MLAAPEDPVRLSPLLEASSGQVLEAVRKLGLEGVVGNGSVPSTIGWLDQAPREPGVHRWRIYPGRRGFDTLLVGVYESKQLMFAAKAKNCFVARIRDEIFPALKTPQTAQCPFKNLPEKRASRWGESLTAKKMDQCRWVKPKLVCQMPSSSGMPATCVIASSSPCAMTRSHRRWFAKLEMTDWASALEINNEGARKRLQTRLHPE
jgi:hypothetical protein